jgi:hypothetical protein
MTGPRRIAGGTDESAISTRWDTVRSVRDLLPPGLRIEGVHGVRVFTPAAAAHRVPVVRGLLGWAESAARDSFLAPFGGFLVLQIRKA